MHELPIGYIRADNRCFKYFDVYQLRCRNLRCVGWSIRMRKLPIWYIFDDDRIY